MMITPDFSFSLSSFSSYLRLHPFFLSLSLSSISVERIMRSNHRGNTLASHDKSRLNSSKKNTKLCESMSSRLISFFLCLNFSGLFIKDDTSFFSSQQEYHLIEVYTDISKSTFISLPTI
jgi:hypothetical protein